VRQGGAMKTSNIKPRWAVATIFATFPAMGLICSLVYRDISMLWASLFFAAMGVVVFPVVVVLLFVAAKMGSLVFAALGLGVSELLRFRRK